MNGEKGNGLQREASDAYDGFTYSYGFSFLSNYPITLCPATKFYFPEKAIISYTLNLNLGYKINEHLELNCNVSYRPLVYTPINLFITENRTTVDENSQISADNDEDISAQLMYNSFYTCDDFWFEIREYDFTSIGVNIGIKFIFKTK